MSQIEEPAILTHARTIAESIIRETQDGEYRKERIEDLMEELRAAEDEVREEARKADIRVRPRPQVDFPDPRSVLQAVITLSAQDAEDALGITSGRPPREMSPREALHAAPELKELASRIAWLGRYEETAAAIAAVSLLENINREMAQEVLKGLSTAQNNALTLAALTEIAGEEVARQRMEY